MLYLIDINSSDLRASHEKASRISKNSHTVLVYNKIDKMDHIEETELLREYADHHLNSKNENILKISAKNWTWNK